jgi:hypothetical protein
VNVAVYQIYYHSDQLPGLDDSFIPYFNKPIGDILRRKREWGVIKQMYRDRSYKNNIYTGCVSWKFREKTRLSGVEFMRRIVPGTTTDVYFTSCGQRKYNNVWEQGERYHPGIIDFTQAIFDGLGRDINIRNMKHYKNKTAFCNFWVGNARFWEKYYDFVSSVDRYIEHFLPDRLQHMLDQQADRKIKSNIVPFVFERLFTTLLAIDSSIQYTNIPRG